MKYKVLGGKWGENYEVGQIIDIDLDAARVRLELGELEEVKNEEIIQKKEEKTEETVDVLGEEEKAKRGRPKLNKV